MTASNAYAALQTAKISANAAFFATLNIPEGSLEGAKLLKEVDVRYLQWRAALSTWAKIVQNS